jgi:hypothetical protein
MDWWPWACRDWVLSLARIEMEIVFGAWFKVAVLGKAEGLLVVHQSREDVGNEH